MDMDVNQAEVDHEHDEQNKENSIVPFFRQLFICSSIVSNFLIAGLYLGSITVLIPQIRKEKNSTEAINSETASWLTSMSSINSLPWTIILPFLADRFGRKKILIVINIATIASSIIFYQSSSVTEIIISQVLIGILFSSISNLTIMVISEYTSPKYRGIFFALKSATLYWGVWISNAIGTYFYWKNICIVIFACCIYNCIIMFYPESPYWLASKNRFEECTKTHRWLKGSGKDADNELKKLISTHSQSINLKQNKTIFLKFYKAITSKIFYKPVLYGILCYFLYNFSGKLVYTMYAIDIIKKITNNEQIAFQGMLILDGVTIFGMYVGSVLTKFIKRRKQMIYFAALGVFFLFSLSLYLYLVKLNVLKENKYVSLFLLSGFSLGISCGPIIMTPCCQGEVAPLKYRSLYLCIASIVSSLVSFICLKTAPTIFREFDAHGAFFFYALSASVFIFLLYKYLPETKDKTIQEIQKCIAGDDFIDNTQKEVIETVPLSTDNKTNI